MAFTKDRGGAVPSTTERPAGYVTSIQAEHFHKQKRYHWMVCKAQNPDELISWGHAPTQEQAENSARNEVSDLCVGRSQGGRIVSAVTPFTKRSFQRR
jgi:hypothetical protein